MPQGLISSRKIVSSGWKESWYFAAPFDPPAWRAGYLEG
jgi:hypothetical protein